MRKTYFIVSFCSSPPGTETSWNTLVHNYSVLLQISLGLVFLPTSLSYALLKVPHFIFLHCSPLILSSYTEYIISFLIYSIQILIFKHLLYKVEHSYLFLFLLHQSYDLLSIFFHSVLKAEVFLTKSFFYYHCSCLLEVENSSGMDFFLLYICLSNSHCQPLASWIFFNPITSLKVLFTQLCLILCNLGDCRWPSSSVHGILQARTLEWVAIPFSRGSSQPRDQSQVSCIVDRYFIIWTTREAQLK